METDLIFTHGDVAELQRFLLAQGAKVVPDKRYKEPEYLELEDVDAALSELEQTKGLFVFQPLSLRCRLEMKPYRERDGYYILPRSGGPAMELHCVGVVRKNAVDLIGTGFLGSYPSFWNAKLGKMERVPPEFSAFCRSTVDFIRNMSTVKRTRSRSFLVGPDAQRLMNAGVRSVSLGEDRSAVH